MCQSAGTLHALGCWWKYGSVSSPFPNTSVSEGCYKKQNLSFFPQYQKVNSPMYLLWLLWRRKLHVIFHYKYIYNMYMLSIYVRALNMHLKTYIYTQCHTENKFQKTIFFMNFWDLFGSWIQVHRRRPFTFPSVLVFLFLAMCVTNPCLQALIHSYVT